MMSEMDNMKIIFSIAVHESRECVLDMCRNISYFVPNSKIILHCARGFDLLIPDELKNAVIINPERFISGFMDGTLTLIHLSNLFFALDEDIGFDYFCPFGSNQLFVKHGFESYISNYDSSLTADLSNLDSQIKIFRRDRYTQKIISSNSYHKSAPEGCFYRGDLVREALQREDVRQWFIDSKQYYSTKYSLAIRKIIRQVIRIFRLAKLEIFMPSCLARFGYATEEVVLPSLFSGQKKGEKTCFIPWDRASLSITKADIDKIVKEETSLYSVKRVERNIDDIIRQYIRVEVGNNYER
ncbi:hypothetical protein ESCOMM167M_22605 [Escherichia coli]